MAITDLYMLLRAMLGNNNLSAAEIQTGQALIDMAERAGVIGGGLTMTSGSGNIDQTAETVLAAMPVSQQTTTPGQCRVRADVWADFLGGVLNGGPQGIDLRIYDTVNTSGNIIGESLIQADYGINPDQSMTQGALARGSWTVAGIHAAHGPHWHCVTATLTNGQGGGSPYTVVLETLILSSAPAYGRP